MQLSLTSALQILVVFQSLLFALFLVVRRGRPDRSSNLYLAALLVLLVVHLGSELLQEAGRIPWGLTWPQLAGLVYGPLFLLFLRSLTFSRPARTADLAHLAPVGVAAVAYLLGLLTPRTLAAAVFVSLGIYVALGARLVVRYRRAVLTTQSNLRRVPMAWLFFAVGGMGVVYLFDLASFVTGSVEHREMPLVSSLPFVALLLYVTGFVICALEKPRLFTGISDEEISLVSATTEPPPSGADDLEDLKRVENVVAAERLYLEPNLTLVDLARVVQLSPRRLSRLVNRGRSQTFLDWINGYRVEEAMRLLAEPGPNSATILAILYAAGFNSKSTFNAVFKQKTGLTPREYRCRHSPA